jgi:transcriptional regulator with XRE-family HTH domain
MVTKIKLRRVSLDMKQQDLARAVGISPQYLRLIESGRVTSITKPIMDGLAAALNTTVPELFYGKEA